MKKMLLQMTSVSLQPVPSLVIYATSFCVNWAFLIARETRLKHALEALKPSLRSCFNLVPRAIRKAQFTQKRVVYKILLFEMTSVKLPNLFKMVSHLLLTVLTNFSRPVRNVTLNVLSRTTVNEPLQVTICSFCFRAVKRQFTKEKNEKKTVKNNKIFYILCKKQVYVKVKNVGQNKSGKKSFIQ
jgi:hypothetical protein